MYRQDLYPPIEPYATGMLPLDSRHTMYWEQSGNPHGVPILFLHGGPGAGATPTHRRFFDPAHYRIVIYDQRGAGRSLPLGSLEDNTLAAPHRRHRDAAAPSRHRPLGGVRRLVGLDPGARLCRGASRPLPRPRAARHLPVPPAARSTGSSMACARSFPRRGAPSRASCPKPSAATSSTPITAAWSIPIRRCTCRRRARGAPTRARARPCCRAPTRSRPSARTAWRWASRASRRITSAPR